LFIPLGSHFWNVYVATGGGAHEKGKKRASKPDEKTQIGTKKMVHF